MKKLFVMILASIMLCAFICGCAQKPDVKHLKDGTYTCSVTLTGAKGEETIKTPATVVVSGGAVSARLVWATRNVEYMIVKGEKYLPVDSASATIGSAANKSFSTFSIPMDFDMDFPVSALNKDVDPDNPIEYVLYFDSSTLRAETGSKYN